LELVLDEPLCIPSRLQAVKELHKEHPELIVLSTQVLSMFLNPEEKLELVEEVLEEVVDVNLLYCVLRQLLDKPKVVF
jgi:hypothetical protein